MKFLGLIFYVHDGVNLKWSTSLQSLVTSVVKFYPLLAMVSMLIIFSMFEALKAKITWEFFSIIYGIEVDTFTLKYVSFPFADLPFVGLALITVVLIGRLLSSTKDILNRLWLNRLWRNFQKEGAVTAPTVLILRMILNLAPSAYFFIWASLLYFFLVLLCFFLVMVYFSQMRRISHILLNSLNQKLATFDAFNFLDM